jgi:hypothetical protein
MHHKNNSAFGADSLKIILPRLSTVAHICNPSYSENRDREGGLKFEDSLGKKLVKPPFSTKKPSINMMVHVCNPSYVEV